jgi:hypothetical protein
MDTRPFKPWLSGFDTQAGGWRVFFSVITTRNGKAERYGLGSSPPETTSSHSMEISAVEAFFKP